MMNQKKYPIPQDRGIFWLLAAFSVLYVIANEYIFTLYDYAFTGDYWEHTGVFAEWSKNLWQPGMPHVSGYENGNSARYMPYYLLLSVISNFLTLSPVQTMSMAGVINVILLCLCIRYFFKSYFQHSLAPVLGIIVLFCFWGFGWYWSNVYQIRNMVYSAGYPSTFTFALCLLSLGYIVNLLLQKHITAQQLVTVLILSFLMFVCHPLTGAFGIGAAGLLSLTHSRASIGIRIKIIGALLVGFIMTELWPYYSAIDIALGQTGKGDTSWIDSAVSKTSTTGFAPLKRAYHLYYSHAFYSPIDFFMSLGPALIGIPIIGWLAYKKQQLFLVSGFVLMMLPFCLNLFVNIPLGHRFLLFAIIFLHIAIVWGLLKIIENPKSKLKNIAIGTTVLILLFNIFLAGSELIGTSYHPNITRTQVSDDAVTVSEQFEELISLIPENAIVMAPLKTSWPLPTFLPAKTVGLFHDNPYLKDYKRRSHDVDVFFDTNTTISSRQEILNRYNVTHIIVPQVESDKIDAINEFSNVGYDVKNLKYWRVITIINEARE